MTGDVRSVDAGEVLRKAAGKAFLIDHKIPWKESTGRFQYGLNSPDEVNMVVLMVEDTLGRNIGHGEIVVDGENAFNAAKRQAILDRLYATFSQLAVFVDIIFSREGIQQGDVSATSLFSNIYALTLEKHRQES